MDPKRARITPSPPLFSHLDDSFGLDPELVKLPVQPEESCAPIHPLCPSCNYHLCIECNNKVQRAFEQEQQFQPRPFEQEPQFQPRPFVPRYDSTTTRSLMRDNELLNLFKRKLTFSSEHLSESQLSSIAIDELKKCPQIQKISILGLLFEQSTISLEKMLKKASKDTTTRRSMYPHLPSAVNTIETMTSCSTITLVNYFDDYTQYQYLFTADVSKQVISIVFTFTNILLHIPEARSLLLAEEVSDSYDIFPKKGSDSDLVKHNCIIGGLYISKKSAGGSALKPLRQTRTVTNVQTSSLSSDCELFSSKKYQSFAIEFVDKIVEVTIHTQMNQDVVVACLDFLSTLNLYNHGQYFECLHKILIDKQLNVIFELENLNHKVVHTLVKFYKTLPLIPEFEHRLTTELFERLVYFIKHYQKPDPLLTTIKSDILFFLARTAHLHHQSLTRAFLNRISDLSQTFMRSRLYVTRVDHDEILTQVEQFCIFLTRDYSKQLFRLSKKKERNAVIQKIFGIKDVFAKVTATFDLTDRDISDLCANYY